MPTFAAPKRMLRRDDPRSQVGPEIDISWVITLFYNGVPIRPEDQVYHIGRHKPPKLKSLLGCSENEWESRYKPAYKELAKQGAFCRNENDSPPTILRRKVPWAPSQKLIEYTGDLFCHHVQQLIASQPYNDSKGHIGDNFELLTHRTMVAHATLKYHLAGWEWVRYCCGPELPKVDLHAFRPCQDIRDVVVEAITDHNDKEMIERKYETFEQHDYRYHWIFENREHAAEALSTLWWKDKLSLKNAPYTNPENYSVQRLNKELKDTIGQNQSEYGLHRVDTLTSLRNSIKDQRATRSRQYYDTRMMWNHSDSVVTPATDIFENL